MTGVNCGTDVDEGSLWAYKAKALHDHGLCKAALILEEDYLSGHGDYYPIEVVADILWEGGHVSEALDIYRLIIKYHPHEYNVMRKLVACWRKELRQKPEWYQRRDNFLNLKEEYAKYKIGDFSYSPSFIIDSYHDGCTLQMGKFCSIAAEARFFLQQEHNTKGISTYVFGFIPGAVQTPPLSRGDIVIGHDVWIGAEAFIMSGVRIGTGAIIGARAVVTKDVEPYSVCVGVPAKVVRKRFSDRQIDELLAIRWWDWSLDEIVRNSADLAFGQADDFIRTWGKR